MKDKVKFILIIMSFLLSFMPILYADQPVNQNAKNSFSNYKLGVGDKVKIQVFGEQDLGIETTLTDAGTITFPLLGELKASGLTIGELTSEIVHGLKDTYLIDPKVTIFITEYRDYYVNGEVQKPGSYHYLPGLTVYKAVSIAGGFTQRASRTSINIVSEKDPSHVQEDVELHMPIHPGDIITVEESFF